VAVEACVRRGVHGRRHRAKRRHLHLGLCSAVWIGFQQQGLVLSSRDLHLAVGS